MFQFKILGDVNSCEIIDEDFNRVGIIDKGDDGFWGFAQYSNPYRICSGEGLREIADKLNELNKEIEEEYTLKS